MNGPLSDGMAWMIAGCFTVSLVVIGLFWYLILPLIADGERPEIAFARKYLPPRPEKGKKHTFSMAPRPPLIFAPKSTPAQRSAASVSTSPFPASSVSGVSPNLCNKEIELELLSPKVTHRAVPTATMM
jgi:hypothetical protein